MYTNYRRKKWNLVFSSSLLKKTKRYLKTQLLFTFFISIPFLSYPQKNEIATYIGKTTNQLKFQIADVYQLKYERNIYRSINIQTGFRYHSEFEWVNGLFTDYTQIIRRSYNSYKVDASILFLPINSDRFKFKVGFGIDMGKSLYSYASKGIVHYVEKPDGVNTEEYWQYTIKNIPDFGCHFILSGNYYLRNNLSISLQLLYNKVYNEDEFSPEINRLSPLCLSLGIGHRF